MKIHKIAADFTQVGNKVLRDPNLSLKAKGLYAWLYSKPDEWDFSMKRVPLESKDGEKAAYAAIRELERAGYVARRKKGDGRMVYLLSPEPDAQNRHLDPGSPNGKLPKGQVAETGTISNTDLEVIQIKSNTDTTPGDFADFWASYPRKVGKAAAAKAWARLGAADRRKALEALPRYVASVDVKREGGRFVLHAATFLNGRRFEDEFVPRAAAPLAPPPGKYGNVGIKVNT